MCMLLRKELPCLLIRFIPLIEALQNHFQPSLTMLIEELAIAQELNECLISQQLLNP